MPRPGSGRRIPVPRTTNVEFERHSMNKILRAGRARRGFAAARRRLLAQGGGAPTPTGFPAASRPIRSRPRAERRPASRPRVSPQTRPPVVCARRRRGPSGPRSSRRSISSGSPRAGLMARARRSRTGADDGRQAARRHPRSAADRDDAYQISDSDRLHAGRRDLRDRARTRFQRRARPRFGKCPRGRQHPRACRATRSR